MVVERDQKDAELDALITEALDVDVQPEFVAQVRTRLATERTRSSWPVAWTLASATALTAIAAIWLVSTNEAPLPSETGTRVAISRAPSVEVSPSIVPPPGAAASPAVEPGTVTPPARRAERTVAAAAAPIAPAIIPEVIISEIIIDAREAIALQALVTRLREGSVDPAQLPAPRAETAAMSADILIQPITVAALAFAADLQLELDVDLPQEFEGLE